jgi:hypothetical protein
MYKDNIIFEIALVAVAFFIILFVMQKNPFKLKGTMLGIYFSPLAGILTGVLSESFLWGIGFTLASGGIITIAAAINKEL